MKSKLSLFTVAILTIFQLNSSEPSPTTKAGVIHISADRLFFDSMQSLKKDALSVAARRVEKSSCRLQFVTLRIAEVMTMKQASRKGACTKKLDEQLEVLYSSKRYFSELLKEAREAAPACAKCEKETDSLRQCPGCGTVHYCNFECQSSDWARHRYYCQTK